MKLYKKIIVSVITLLISLTLVSLNPNEVLALDYNEYGPYYQETINTFKEVSLNSVQEKSFNPILNLNEGENQEVAEERLQGFYEDTSQRDAYTKVYISDNSEEEHVYLYMSPVHEWVNNKWESIDTTIESTNFRNIEFENNNTLRNITINQNEIIMDSLSLQKPTSITKIDDNQVLYQDGTDFYATYKGYILTSSFEAMEEGYIFKTEDNGTLRLSEYKNQIILEKDGVVETIITLKSIHNEETEISSNFGLDLVEKKENTYQVTLDIQDITTFAGFDVDLEVSKVIEN